MMTFFTWAMADMQKTDTHSKAVNECMDYIHYHLHEKITVAILAQHVHLNPTYLSELFARETGTSLSQYITDKRMEAAENMLKYSEYSFNEIAQILAYRSQSHFTKVFKKHSGMTPGSTAPSTHRTASGRSSSAPACRGRCGEPDVTTSRTSVVPIVKSMWFRVWHTFESATVKAFNDDARRPNERQNGNARRMCG